MRIWRLPEDTTLTEVTTWCLRKENVDRLLAVHRFDYQAPEKELLYPVALEIANELFAGKVLRERRVFRWPCTISTKHRALVQVVAFDSDLATSMHELAPRLFDWLGSTPPSLPEDLCLYRSGATWPSLVSVTHERDAWILADRRPSLEVEEETHLSLEGYIPRRDPDFLGDTPAE